MGDPAGVGESYSLTGLNSTHSSRYNNMNTTTVVLASTVRPSPETLTLTLPHRVHCQKIFCDIFHAVVPGSAPANRTKKNLFRMDIIDVKEVH